MKKLLLGLLCIFSVASCDNTDNSANIDGGKIDNENVIEEVILRVEDNYGEEANNSYPGQDANVFIPEFPTEFKAYFVASEKTDKYEKGQLLATHDVHIGDNKIKKLPKNVIYNVHVSNYTSEEDPEWYQEYDSETRLPSLTDKIYLYAKTKVDFNKTDSLTMVLYNQYACLELYKGDIMPALITEAKIIHQYPDYINFYEGNKDWWYMLVRKDILSSVHIQTSIFDKDENQYEHYVTFPHYYPENHITIAYAHIEFGKKFSVFGFRMNNFKN